MELFVRAIYFTLIYFIRAYRWLEYQTLRLFTPLIKQKLRRLFASGDVILHFPGDDDALIEGTKLAGRKPILHVQINNENILPKVVSLGLLAIGEGYMDNSWFPVGNDPENLTELAVRIYELKLQNMYYHPWNIFLEWIELYAFNLQTHDRAWEVGVHHYDLGNDFFEVMLDPWMQYTGAYWKNAKDLNEAQIHKMDLIAKKLDLKPGMRVLDLGCGWGTLAKYLVQNYQVSCVGVTISKNGAEYAKKICAGLPVEIRLQDYRSINEKFDRIACIEMLEHVGFRNYKTFFKVIHRCLKDDGIFLMQTFARNHPNVPRTELFAHRYIFPNANLPDVEDIAKTSKELFVIEDWHNFGQDFAKTFLAWRENLIKGWPTIKNKYGGDRFYKMWIAYLSYCRANFKSRRYHLWQLVMRKNGLLKEYRAVR